VGGVCVRGRANGLESWRTGRTVRARQVISGHVGAAAGRGARAVREKISGGGQAAQASERLGLALLINFGRKL
jgi:hypothetical protein